MKVYVLEHRWDTPSNEGSEVRVFGESNLKAARQEMQESVEAVKEEYREIYGCDPWEEDYTWQGENEVHLGYDQCGAFTQATIYSWEIFKREVQ